MTRSQALALVLALAAIACILDETHGSTWASIAMVLSAMGAALLDPDAPRGGPRD